jgi:8-oxo-dGTP pyrophosphatase MutT (NUDIX family)
MKNKKEKIVYQGKIIEVVNETILSKNGKEIVIEKARRSPGVRLIIKTLKGNFILSKEKRHELEKVDFRLPGGKVFDTLEEYNKFLKSNGNLLIKAGEVARLEAIQEVGIRPEKIEYFATSHCGATVDWDLIYFVVKKYKKVEQQLEEHEDIEVVEVSSGTLKKWALSGKIQEDRSVAVILKYLTKK